MPAAEQNRSSARPTECPHLLDMRVIFMDGAVGRWGPPSVEMEALPWCSPSPA